MFGNEASRTLHNFEEIAHCALAEVRYAFGHDGYFKPLTCGNVNQYRDYAVCFPR